MPTRATLSSSLKILAAIAAVVAVLAGCNTVTPKVTSVTIAGGNLTLEVGQTQKLSATVKVTGGAATTVSWKSSNAAVASVANDGTVTAKAVGTAKITATSTADGSKSDSVDVTVQAPPPTTPTVNSFGASPDTLDEGLGGTATLSWDVSGATSYALSDGTNDITIPQTATGSVDVSPDATTTYTLTATNGAGDTTATATVTVTPASAAPTVNSFQGSATGVSAGTTIEVAPGTTVSLAWDVSAATSLSLSDGTNDIAITQALAGSVDVTPTDPSTTYTLTASNSAGDTTADVTVTLAAPTITGLTATNALGSTVDLSWSATDATDFDVYAVLDTDATDQVLVQAGVTGTSINVPMPVSNRQTLRVVANGAGGTASADVALENVVVSSADYDPYDLQPGIFTPETPIPGTLRYLINNAAPGSIIGFASDITAIDVAGVEAVDVGGTNIDAHLILRNDVTVSGPASGVVLNGVSNAPGTATPAEAFTWESRMMYVMPGVTATLDHLTIQGGEFIFSGAGVRNDGTLTISNSTVTGNRAWYEGGGLWNAGGASLTVTDSHIDGNTAAVLDSEYNQSFAIRGGSTTTVSDGGYGGALYNKAGGSVTITNTTFDGNDVKYSGGALFDEGLGSTVTLSASPVSNNVADYTAYANGTSPFSYGGGIYTSGTLSYSGADITGNTATDLGGGLMVDENGAGTLDTVFLDGNNANFGGAIEHKYCSGTDPTLTLGLTNVTYGTNTAGTTGPDLNEEAVTCPTPLMSQSVQSRPYPDPATLR